MATALVGITELVRLAVRRDRIMLPAWTAVFVSVAAVSATATTDLYPTVGARVQAAGVMNSTPALVALYGRVFDPTSLGALSMWKLTAFGATLVAVLNVLLVIRHSRAEEESGRLELLGAAVLGRHAPLGAALVVALGADLAIGLLTALALVGAGLPIGGSFAFGLSWAAVGGAFAGVAAVAAQLTGNARAAIGLALAGLGAAYLLRAVGDTSGAGGPRWLSWLSPLGWGQQVRPYAGERWWVLALPLGFGVATVAGAHLLTAHRDLGTGLLADRLGPAAAPRSLSGPFGLAWRLHRGALWAWLAGFAVLGAVLGSIASSVGGLLDNPQVREMLARLGGTQLISDAFLAVEFGICGVVAAAYGVSAVLRLRSEETELRAEPVLATGVGRVRWMASHLVMAASGVATLLVVAGLGAGLAHGARTGQVGHEVVRLVGSALVQLPAGLVLVGVTAALFGALPHQAAAAWGALVFFLLLGEVGPLLRLDQWVMDLSPFGHLPRVPGNPVTVLPLVVLTVVSAVLVVAGLWGFRRRDVR
jgi:ABC-2 type transport system permease protein